MEHAAKLLLAERGYRSLLGITCVFAQGAVILHGRVPTYHQKQLAQESLRILANGRKIVNDIEVSNCHASGPSDLKSSSVRDEFLEDMS
jgi:hypothetical protein